MWSRFLLVFCFAVAAWAQKLPSTISQAVFDTWSKQTVYFVIPDRFYNGDKKNDFNVNLESIKAFHGGDLRGIVDKFDYFKKLKVGTLLFTPIVDNRATDFYDHWGFHGYWVVDHLKPDRHLGDEKMVKEFTQKRLKEKTKFLVDIVLNHVSWDHPWQKSNPDWFHKLGSISDFNDYKQLTQGELTGLPDLAQEHPEVFKKLVEYTKFWIDLTRADGIRMDAVKHIDHPFWKKYISEINQYVKQKYKQNDFLFLGEFLHGDANFYKDYLADGFNAFYDFPIHYAVRDVFALNQPMLYLPSKLQFTSKIFPEKMMLLTFIDNHDLPRFLGLAENVTVEDMHQALAFITTIRGIPMIYYGTEEHMKGEDGDLGRHSLAFNFTSTFDYIAKLNEIRANSVSLQRGIREDIDGAKDYYVFRKIADDEESLIFFTRGDQERTLEIKLPAESKFAQQKMVSDRLSARTFKVQGKTLKVKLNAKDVVLFTQKGKNDYYQKLKKLKRRPIEREIVVNFPTRGNAPKEDEGVYVIGSNEQIGGWDKTKALGPMTKIDDLRYSIKVPLTSTTVLEYKFVKIKRDGNVRWEHTPNRLIFMNDETKTIEGTWNKVD